MYPHYPQTRLRRLRSSQKVRDFFRENEVTLNDLVLPIFVDERATDFVPISSMPGVLRIPERKLAVEVERYAKAGIRALMVFGISHHKDDVGSDTWSDNGLVARMVGICKATAPELVVMVDTCFCEYTTHGHCGVVAGNGVDNDATLVNLARQAVTAAHAGADIIAPSTAMDGQVGAIRSALEENGFVSTAVMSYSTKFASSLYGPFRDAAGCDLHGDRKSYQMDPMNRREAIRESRADEAEGADALMVKPAGAYLDIIRDIRNETDLPIGAYQTSGEYAMLKFAAAAGALDERRAVWETLGAIKRAGADRIFTYFALDIATGRL